MYLTNISYVTLLTEYFVRYTYYSHEDSSQPWNEEISKNKY